MDRRGFLQTTGLGAVAAVAGRSATICTAANPEPKTRPVKQLPSRSEVALADTWDLTTLFPTDAAWEEAFTAWQKQIDGYTAFSGHLAESPQKLAECLTFDQEVERVGERLGTYASLKACEDQGNSTYQRMQGRFMQTASRAAQVASYLRPEILEIPADKMDAFLKSPELKPYKLMVTRILRFKPHTLGEKEERLLAMQTEMSEAASKIFRQLNDTDMKFGTVTNEKGEPVELSHASFSALALFARSQGSLDGVPHLLSAVHGPRAHAGRVAVRIGRPRRLLRQGAQLFRRRSSPAMFPDLVPVSVYDNLIASIHRQLPALHHYYDVRRRKMKLDEIHHYDTYVPILWPAIRTHHTWDEAVKAVLAALEPLGSEYCGALDHGLNNRWCDRYEKPRQAERRVFGRLLRRPALHPDELPARRARPRLHAGP